MAYQDGHDARQVRFILGFPKVLYMSDDSLRE